MDVDPEFNLEIVKDFIVSRLGKVTNHELVSHFKPFLSNPEKKGEFKWILRGQYA